MSIFTPRWFFIGQAFFGFLIGLLVGLSTSPVVGTVLGLLFAFVGGSIIVLMKGRSDAELVKIGISISVMSIFIFLGVVAGIVARESDVLTIGERYSPPFKISDSLTLDDIIKLSKNKKIDPAIICLVIKSSKLTVKKSAELSTIKLMELMESGVNANVIYSLISKNSSCYGQAAKNISDNSDSKGGLFLYKGNQGCNSINKDLEEP